MNVSFHGIISTLQAAAILNYTFNENWVTGVDIIIVVVVVVAAAAAADVAVVNT